METKQIRPNFSEHIGQEKFGATDVLANMDSVFEDLLAAARAGGEWAWSRLYDKYSPRLLAYARGRGAVEPEDLVGEVFLQIVRDIASFEGAESEFRRWIFTITRHRIIDDHRRRQRRPFDPSVPADMSEFGATGDAEAEAVELLTEREVLDLLARLTPDQRDVLILRIHADLTIDQIAKVMGRKPGAIKALQRRGLGRLKEILESAVTISSAWTL